jgi:hypothetical protein
MCVFNSDTPLVRISACKKACREMQQQGRNKRFFLLRLLYVFINWHAPLKSRFWSSVIYAPRNWRTVGCGIEKGGKMFVLEEGVATFLIDSTTLEVQAGSIVIVPPGAPHKFTNTGERRLRQIDIHQSPQIVTEWLES